MQKIIKIVEGTPQVIDDHWELIRTDAPDSSNVAGRIVPFAYFRTEFEQWEAPHEVSVWISPDDDFEPFVPQLVQLGMIAVDFPSFRDGRGYSVATLLRKRYGWTGELRAVGDVLRDQLNYMRRCGFDSFAVRADKDIYDALKSFSHYSVQYQGAVDNPLPLFRRRAGVTTLQG